MGHWQNANAAKCNSSTQIPLHPTRVTPATNEQDYLPYPVLGCRSDDGIYLQFTCMLSKSNTVPILKLGQG